MFNHKRTSKKNLKSYLILLTKFGLDTDGFGKRFLKNEVHEIYKEKKKKSTVLPINNKPHIQTWQGQKY